MTGTLNANEMKARNRARILAGIRRSGGSRAQLAKETGLTRAALTLIVEDFLSRGIVAESEKLESPKGRKSVSLRLNPGYGFAVGVNLSRTGYSVGMADFGGEILAIRRGGACGSRSEQLARMEEDVRACIRTGRGNFLGIGITAPGPLDRGSGTLLNIPNFEIWKNFGISGHFAQRFGCPVRLENNSNALALAECAYNPRVRESSFLELIVDSGLGSSVKLRDRAFVSECELGHTTVDVKGERCDCGNIGCAELYASMRAAVREGLAISPQFESWKEILDAALSGHPACTRLLDRECELLATLAVNGANCFPLEAIVFAGEIVYRFSEVLPRIERAVSSRLFSPRAPELLPSSLKEPEILSSVNLVLDRLIESGMA